jgi:hypothetical protein
VLSGKLAAQAIDQAHPNQPVSTLPSVQAVPV